jgi:hypothetical protein
MLFLALAGFFAYGAIQTGGGEAAVLTILAAVAVAGAVRMARSGVYVTQDGITVRDLVRTRHLRWHDICDISAASDDSTFRTLGIVMRDGTRVRCFALSPMRFEDLSGHRFQLLHERLARQVERARADGRCPNRPGDLRY